MARLFERRLGSRSDYRLRPQEFQIPNDLLHMARVGLALNAAVRPAHGAVEDLDLSVVLEAWTETPRFGELVPLLHLHIHPVELPLWP